ncbi:MAG TPA: HAD-IA family hydrolase [Burkholderiales bacterium]|nr:HAD-IA family hydrolase [Burkholderiales bacterium]
MKYKAVLFDLLTGLLDSWSVWNRVAGDEAAGRRWRAAYLELTYGCGAYRPYEALVAEAARQTGLPEALAAALEDEWKTIKPWHDTRAVLRTLKKDHELGIVTNCSERLGRAAASRLDVAFDVIVTSERAGFYKPDPAPYRLALSELNLHPTEVLFVAGSGFDLIGAARVGLDTYWHNRIGLQRPAGAPAPLRESRSLDDLVMMVTI